MVRAQGGALKVSWAKLLRRDLPIWAITGLFAVLGYLVTDLVLSGVGGHTQTRESMFIVPWFFMMLLPPFGRSLRFPVGTAGVRLNEVLDVGCSWLQRLREKAEASGVDEVRLIEMDSPFAMGANAVSPDLLVLPSRLKQLLDSEEQYAVAVRELAHLIQINEHERNADIQRWIGATLAVAALFSGGIVSVVDHWLTMRGSTLLEWVAVVPIAALACALGALTAAGAEGFSNSTTGVDAKSVSMGVDPRVLLSTLIKIGFDDQHLSVKHAPRFAAWWAWKLNRRLCRLAQSAGLTAKELEELYRSLAAERAQSAKT